MKKFAPIALIALFGVLSMASCKKDYTCECSSGGVVVGTVTIHNTKSKAKSACNTTVTSGGVSETCTLK